MKIDVVIEEYLKDIPFDSSLVSIEHAVTGFVKDTPFTLNHVKFVSILNDPYCIEIWIESDIISYFIYKHK